MLVLKFLLHYKFLENYSLEKTRVKNNKINLLVKSKLLGKTGD